MTTSSTIAARWEAARGPPPVAVPRLRGGDAADNLAFSMASMFLLLYYTDVVGISAAAAGTLFLVVRAWDAFADSFAGRVVDSTWTRWGKFRPFFLYGSLHNRPLVMLCGSGLAFLTAIFSLQTVRRTTRVTSSGTPATSSCSPW